MTLDEDDPDVAAFLRHAEEEMAPKLRASGMSLSLVPTGTGDPKFWVELGAAIMFEKPLILLVTEGCSIPQKLQQVAEEVIFIPASGPDEDTARAIAQAMARVDGA